MSAKVWVVSRVGWEYDDSRYYRPESDGSHPVAALTLSDLAQKICDEKNISELKSLGHRGLIDFIDSYDYDSDSEEHLDFLKSHSLDEDFEFTKPLSEIPNETLLNVLDYFSLSFYEVIEVELLA